MSYNPDIISTVGNQSKMLKKIVGIIFEKSFLANFTWSGKSVRGKKKIQLRIYKNIVDFMYGIANGMDKTYQHSTYLDILKNKVIKYAYE